MSRLKPTEPTTVGRCAYCGGEIYAGEPVKRIDDGEGFVHDGFNDNCAQEYANERVYDAEGEFDEEGRFHY